MAGGVPPPWPNTRRSRNANLPPAGIRTFTVAALAGALSALLGGVLMLVAATVVIGALVALSYWRTRKDGDPGLTTELALVATALIGMLALSRPALAAACGVVLAGLLVLTAIGWLVHRHRARELRAGDDGVPAREDGMVQNVRGVHAQVGGGHLPFAPEHAQDRLWQMEFQRRIGFGRLSEVLGAAALPQDRFLRTVGFGRAARSAWQHLSAEARTDINAYVAGINAFLASHHGRQLPPEFTLLNFEPEPWSGEDVLVWVKMMAWDLGANYSLELFRRDLVEKVGAERAAQLMPPYPADAPTIMGAALGTDAPSHDARDPGAPSSVTPSSSTNNVAPSAEPAAATATMATTGVIPAWSELFREALSVGHPAVTEFLLNGARTEALGSNNWVIDGTMTASGKPMLANDPHRSEERRVGKECRSRWSPYH